MLHSARAQHPTSAATHSSVEYSSSSTSRVVYTTLVPEGSPRSFRAIGGKLRHKQDTVQGDGCLGDVGRQSGIPPNPGESENASWSRRSSAVLPKDEGGISHAEGRRQGHVFRGDTWPGIRRVSPRVVRPDSWSGSTWGVVWRCSHGTTGWQEVIRPVGCEMPLES